MSLKSAERVFTCISDYDNSGFINNKREFLDKLMAIISQKNSYVNANFVLQTMRVMRQSTKNDFQELQNCSGDKKDITVEPEKKRPRLELDHLGVIKDKDSKVSDKHKHKTESNCSEKITSFRVSIKCSGKLGKKLDLKRLSRDVAWRVEQASGWKVQLRRPDLEVCIHISDEHVTIGVPLTKHPLSQRSYIKDSGLRSPVAWIMCSLAEMKFGDIVLDPMCGKATILLEGASNWKDTFYIGSDNSKVQIKIALQNTMSHSKKMEVLLSNGLNMPYRNCSADIVVCDAPFNQKHLTSVTPKEFYEKFLHEIHRVLQMNGRCILLLSQELVSLILTVIQSSNSATENLTSYFDSPPKNQELNMQVCSDNTQSPLHVRLQAEHQDKNLLSNTSNLLDNFHGTYIPNVKTKLMENSHTSSEAEDCQGKEKNRLFELVSRHAVKLGETLACIIKLIKI